MVILIADDNKLSRFTIENMLEDIVTTEYTVLEAANGKEMIEICKEKKPDIVFADIKMPYVNGIDAIAECKKYHSDMAFVIVSGYSDFEVAQRALSLNVQDYLLKPVDEDKLRQVMEKLQKKLEKEKEKKNARFQLHMFNAFNYFRILGENTEYEEEPLHEKLQYEVISVRSRYATPDQQFYVKFQNRIIQEMEEIGAYLLKNGSRYSHFYSDEGTVFFVFCTTKKGCGEIRSFIKKISDKNTNRNLLIHFIRFSGRSLRKVYLQCKKLDECKGIEMNYPAGELIDFDSSAVSEQGREILSQISRVIDAWERGDSFTYKEILYHLSHKYQKAGTDINIEFLSSYCSNIMRHNISGGSMQELFQSLMQSASSVFENTKMDKDVVEMVKTYIERNYMNDIGVAHVAEVFEITPNYLSSIFHQKVGCKFTDYLTKVRMEEAKRLLAKNKTTSINDVAVKVGYNSSGYFTMVFQKVIGMTPSAYRKEYLNS